jgi:hypothetical protein
MLWFNVLWLLSAIPSRPAGRRYQGAGAIDYDTASRYYDTLVSGYLRTAPVGALEEAVARFAAPVRSAFVHDQAPESTIDAMLWAAWERPPNPADLRAAVPWFRHSGAALSCLAHQPGSPGDGDRGPARLGRLCTALT